jgi:hypothetical protein
VNYQVLISRARKGPLLVEVEAHDRAHAAYTACRMRGLSTHNLTMVALDEYTLADRTIRVIAKGNT